MSAKQHSTVSKHGKDKPSSGADHEDSTRTRSTGRVLRDDGADPSPPPTTDVPCDDPEQQRRLETFQDVHTTGKWGAISRKEILGVGLTLVVVVAGVTLALVLLGQQQQHRTNRAAPVVASPPPVVRDTPYYSAEAHYQALRDAIQSRGGGSNDAASTASTTRIEAVATILTHLVPHLDDLQPVDVYSQAAYWLMKEDIIPSSVESDLLPRFVMAVTYFAHGGDGNSSSWIASNEWMTYVDQCEWYGVTCNTEHEIMEVDLSSNGLTGDMHMAWFLLDHCTSIMLSGNALTGPVPGGAFAGMSSLIYLHLQGNALTGSVPLALQEATRLDTLFIQGNNMNGAWPMEFCPTETSDAPFTEFGMDCSLIKCDCCTAFNCFN